MRELVPEMCISSIALAFNIWSTAQAFFTLAPASCVNIPSPRHWYRCPPRPLPRGQTRLSNAGASDSCLLACAKQPMAHFSKKRCLYPAEYHRSVQGLITSYSSGICAHPESSPDHPLRCPAQPDSTSTHSIQLSFSLRKRNSEAWRTPIHTR